MDVVVSDESYRQLNFYRLEQNFGELSRDIVEILSLRIELVESRCERVNENFVLQCWRLLSHWLHVLDTFIKHFSEAGNEIHDPMKCRTWWFRSEIFLYSRNLVGLSYFACGHLVP